MVGVALLEQRTKTQSILSSSERPVGKKARLERAAFARRAGASNVKAPSGGRQAFSFCARSASRLDARASDTVVRPGSKSAHEIVRRVVKS